MANFSSALGILLNSHIKMLIFKSEKYEARLRPICWAGLYSQYNVTACFHPLVSNCAWQVW